jgi:hypothetical protein
MGFCTGVEQFSTQWLSAIDLSNLAPGLNTSIYSFASLPSLTFKAMNDLASARNESRCKEVPRPPVDRVLTPSEDPPTPTYRSSL